MFCAEDFALISLILSLVDLLFVLSYFLLLFSSKLLVVKVQSLYYSYSFPLLAILG